MKCQHEYGPLWPNGYRECKICRDGQLLEDDEIKELEKEKTEDLLSVLYGGP